MKTRQRLKAVMDPGLTREFISAIIESVPVDLPCHIARSWISRKRVLVNVVRRLLIGGPSNNAHVDWILSDWKVFWATFGFNIDEISVATIPQRPPGFERLLVVPKGLTTERMYGVCQGLFNCWRWTNDLNKVVSFNVRAAEAGSYAVWIREATQADEEFENQSTKALTRMKHNGITLLERLVYEAKYVTETGEHLDTEKVTLCSGSRYFDGGVPSVYWDLRSSELTVMWEDPTHKSEHLRSRRVVS